MITRTLDAMGTVFSLSLEAGLVPLAETETAIEGVWRLIRHFDDTYTLYRPDSPINLFRRGKEVELGEEFDEILELSAHATALTQGLFDPWTPEGFDPTGIVKGYAAERAVALLNARGIDEVTLNAGGDIALSGQRRRRLGITHPFAVDTLWGIVEVGEGGLATSGVYQQGAHIYHPRQGDIAAVAATVFGTRLSIADALATACVAGGADCLSLIAQSGYEALVIDPTGRATHTRGFRELFVSVSPEQT